MTKCTVFPVIDLTETGRQIEKSRKAAGLSVKDVQAYFGFEYPQAVYKWQHGECLPSVDNLLALSRLLGTPMEDLLVYEDQEVPYFWGSAIPFVSSAAFSFTTLLQPCLGSCAILTIEKSGIERKPVWRRY